MRYNKEQKKFDKGLAVPKLLCNSKCRTPKERYFKQLKFFNSCFSAKKSCNRRNRTRNENNTQEQNIQTITLLEGICKV